MKAAIYVRVSTLDQHAANQLPELHKYVADRGWEAQEFVDRGVSGAKDSRPALNRLLADARRHRFDVIVVWSLDRLGRSLKHLVGLLDDPQAMGCRHHLPARGTGLDDTERSATSAAPRDDRGIRAGAPA